MSKVEVTPKVLARRFDTGLTVMHLEVLLHCYTFADPWTPANRTSESARSAFEVLEREGYIHNPTDSGQGWAHDVWEVTDAGRAWVKLILSTPPPMKKEVWVDAHGKIIE